MPPEVGGGLTPTGAYKSGMFVAGTTRMQPRLEGDFGWLLLAGCGSCSTVADSPEAGLNTHYFRFVTDDDASAPWLAVRKLLPGATAAQRLGIDSYDNRLTRLQVTFPGAGLLMANCDFQGRRGSMDRNPSWTYVDDYESFPSIPITCKGSLTIEGAEYPITGAVLDLVNQFTTPDQERIIGSYFADDFAMVGRRATLRLTYKWADPALYEQLHTGVTDGNNWSPIPWIGQRTGAIPAIAITVESPDNIPTFSNPYSLTVRGDYLVLQPAGPIALEAGGMLTMDLIATLLDPGASLQYIEFVLVNQQANYNLPT